MKKKKSSWTNWSKNKKIDIKKSRQNFVSVKSDLMLNELWWEQLDPGNQMAKEGKDEEWENIS